MVVVIERQVVIDDKFYEMGPTTGFLLKSICYSVEEHWFLPHSTFVRILLKHYSLVKSLQSCGVTKKEQNWEANKEEAKTT